MIELTTRAGLAIGLEEEELIFGDGIEVEESKTRTRGELAAVAREPEACMPFDEVQYWMWNGIVRAAHRDLWRASRLRYELTLISPRALGAEKPKTLGHIHNAPTLPAPPSRQWSTHTRRGTQAPPTFAEIFEVLHGTAHFMFYALDRSKMRATFCGIAEARAGEQIVCPPNLYHLTINAGDAPLLFADLISRRAFGIYDDVKATHGAPYYELETGDWARNPHFDQAPLLTPYNPPRLDASLPLYTQFVLGSSTFSWLDDPAVFFQKFQSSSSAWI